MTLAEAGMRFSISIENLKFYEENGLLRCSCQKKTEFPIIQKKIWEMWD